MTTGFPCEVNVESWTEAPDKSVKVISGQGLPFSAAALDMFVNAKVGYFFKNYKHDAKRKKEAQIGLARNCQE